MFLIRVPGLADRRFATLNEVNAYYKTLPKYQREEFSIRDEALLAAGAAQQKKVIDRQKYAARITELITQHGCSRVWAYELLRRELAGVGLQKRGAKPRYDQARLTELMTEHGCSRVKAYALLKQELAASEKLPEAE
jgi:hypothetical protein